MKKQIVIGVMTALIIAIITTCISTLISSGKQVENNRSTIFTLTENIAKMDISHSRRLEILEQSRENMSDYYVTRREFNVVIQSLDEKMNKVDKNVEKLLDLQMKEK